MQPHIHATFLDGAIIFLFVILFGGVWRWVAMRLADRPIGQAMAFVY
jgi:hypothetical protein